jgi:hypothetical protein
MQKHDGYEPSSTTTDSTSRRIDFGAINLQIFVTKSYQWDTISPKLWTVKLKPNGCPLIRSQPALSNLSLNAGDF